MGESCQTPIIQTPIPKMSMTSRCLKGLQTILRNLSTGKDNKTHDLGRVGIEYGLLTLTILVGYQEHQGIHTAAKDMAIAISIILAGGGAGLALKAKTEPGDSNGVS